MAAIRLLVSLVPRFAALLAFLLLSSPAWSQYSSQYAAPGSDRGEWQIMEARYGTRGRNIDVTAQLKQLARRDSTFRVTNDLFGNDPDPGVVKTLRIYARGPGGNRIFEYHENDIVSGTAFSGWSSGNWGSGWSGGWGGAAYGSGDRGQWQILQARYGTARGNIDVTAQLRDLPRKNANFQVTNRLFGNDPDPGVVKTLRIYARGPGGNMRTFEYGENQYVDGANFTGWRSGNWGRGGWNGGWGHDSGPGIPQGGVTIVSAQYGVGSNRWDVTGRVRSMIPNGRISTRGDNDGMGGDPAGGRRKSLWVTYYVGGEGQRQTRVDEGAMLQLP